MSEFEDKPERWLDVRWDEEERTPRRFPARIAVQSVNEPGSLAQIAQVIAEHDGNIDNIRMTRRAPDFTDVMIDLEVLRPQAFDCDIGAVAREAGGGQGREGERLAHGSSSAWRQYRSRRYDPQRAGRPSSGSRAGAKLAIAAGCDGITAHLREDRRHIRDDDIARLKAEIDKPLNFEMAATEEMIDIALKTKPHAACLVPERRTERTTEGGLDAVGQRAQLAPAIRTLKAAGIRVSFLSARRPRRSKWRPSSAHLRSKSTPGAGVMHWLERRMREAEAEWQIIRDGAERASRLGLEVHAGHGLDYGTAETIAALPQVVELNIGHFLIGESVFEGLAETIKFMRAAMDRGRKKGARMIIGLGSDIVDVRRIAKVIERHGDRFLDRIFTTVERSKAGGQSECG